AAVCPTRHAAVPVSRPVVDDLRLVRWEEVVTCTGRPEGTTRFYLPTRSEAPPDGSPWHKGIELLAGGDGARAVEWFSAQYGLADPDGQAVVGRWVVLALVKAGRAAEAAGLAAKMAAAYPTHPDYQFLAVLAARAAGIEVDGRRALAVTEVLERGAFHDEWFDQVRSLLWAALPG
ncbi:MAG: hypothetical protein ACRDWN_10605, partial [Acidimicrobiales bacterium]